MSTVYSFFANPSAPTESVSCRSGNTYTGDASGIIHNVSPQDVLDVLQSGAKLIDSLPNLPIVTGRFYGIPKGATLTTLLTVLGTIYAYPIVVPNLMALKSLNASVTTGQTGGKVRMGIYSDYDGLPQTLFTGTDSGDVAATGTAVGTFTAGSGVFIPPGVHWLALQATASSTMPSVEALAAAAGSELSTQLGYDTAAHALAGSAEYVSGIAVTGATYGAMPTTFPTGATLTINAATPAIAVGF